MVPATSKRELRKGVAVRTLANMAVHSVYHECDSGRHGVQVQMWFGLMRGTFDALRAYIVRADVIALTMH